MIFRSATRAVVVLAASAALAQSAQPGTTPAAPILNLQAPTGRRAPMANKTADPQSLAAMREQVENMDSTLSQMRSLLRQMRAKATTSKATDSLTKVNLDMWDLMVGHLDKELQHMRLTVAAREDLEARRAALYRQADAKAEAEAQAARASQAARFAQAEKATGTATPAATGPATAQSAERNSAAQAAPAQPSDAPATNNSASPK